MSLERGIRVSASQSDPTGTHTAGAPSAESVDPHETATTTDHAVDVRVSAEPSQLPVMRAVVGDLAMRADFDVDAIADLRLAVDEVCSSLVRIAAPSATLLCRFSTGVDTVSITAEVDSHEASAPRTNTFSWRVLSALADDVASSVVAPTNGTDTHVVRIELSKGRTVHE